MAHFGLGDVKSVQQVRIIWPNGKQQILQNVAADQVLTVWQRDAQRNRLIFATQNRGPLRVFEQRGMVPRWLPVRSDDAYALVRFQNGRTRRYELYSGASFMSQSVRQIPLTKDVISVEIVNFKGQKRLFDLSVPPA